MGKAKGKGGERCQSELLIKIAKEMFPTQFLIIKNGKKLKRDNIL